MPAAKRGTTSQRGLGYRHKMARQRLLDLHIEGTACWWDGEPMYKAQGLHADHSVPRSQGGVLPDRLLHSWCNEARGDGGHDHMRPAVTGVKARMKPNPVDLGTLVMRWPWQTPSTV